MITNRYRAKSPLEVRERIRLTKEWEKMSYEVRAEKYDNDFSKFFNQHAYEPESE
jgi:hypothetical protein